VNTLRAISGASVHVQSRPGDPWATVNPPLVTSEAAAAARPGGPCRAGQLRAGNGRRYVSMYRADCHGHQVRACGARKPGRVDPNRHGPRQTYRRVKLTRPCVSPQPSPPGPISPLNHFNMLLEKPCFQSRIFLQNRPSPLPPSSSQCMQERRPRNKNSESQIRAAELVENAEANVADVARSKSRHKTQKHRRRLPGLHHPNAGRVFVVHVARRGRAGCGAPPLSPI
jgi:hypothetical protein